MSTMGDDDLAAEVDEPPDTQIQFVKKWTSSSHNSNTGSSFSMSPQHVHNRTESLLTQALLTSPEMTPLSDAEAPVLTSDGGMTSPARTSTPSPPLPYINHMHLGTLVSDTKNEKAQDTSVQIPHTANVGKSQETKVEEGLGRKRCISFACGGQAAAQKKVDLPVQAQDTSTLKSAEPLKRPCILRFACPMKPVRNESSKAESVENIPSSKDKDPVPITHAAIESLPGPKLREHRDYISPIKNSPPKDTFVRPSARGFNRVDFQKSEATRFNEFAGTLVDDDWTNEQTAYRQKITVNDTLRKENAIRQLAYEAEEETLEEEAEEAFDNGNSQSDQDDDDRDGEELDEASDDGNETDDEEGFAESDDESDVGSEYRFWTPGLTTAATSTEQLEHIRPAAHRVASESSIESIVDNRKDSARRRKEPLTHRRSKMRPGTPELPDTTEFVIGTLDEDRPLEDAYKSCLEERRRLKHHLIPQDIDPSFPTSEPDDDDKEDQEEDEDDDAATQLDDEPEWVTGRLESSEEENLAVRIKSSSWTRATKSPMASPKRYHSPPPPFKRKTANRSPPPRNLFGQSIRHLRSPHPAHRKPNSPPSSRRPSPTGSPSTKPHGISMPHLAQRPNLTHTTSLPRTPNPFWNQHRRARFHGAETPSTGTSPTTMGQRRSDSHTRGPIDIVQGLETKRQRRKEKFWRQHCRDTSKTKERRCQPGKGAVRMKELGEMMKDRCKGYGQKAQLVLSV